MLCNGDWAQDRGNTLECPECGVRWRACSPLTSSSERSVKSASCSVGSRPALISSTAWPPLLLKSTRRPPCAAAGPSLTSQSVHAPEHACFPLTRATQSQHPAAWVPTAIGGVYSHDLVPASLQVTHHSGGVLTT